MKKRDLLSVTDLTAPEIKALLQSAVTLKTQSTPNLLSGKTLGLLFEKPSLRTRVSFEIAMGQLGGNAIYLSPVEVGLGERESVPDVARVLSRYVDIIAARTFSHHNLEILAEYSRVPVINALSDLEHPCQALSDLLTIAEKKGKIAGLTLAFIGDGNNVARSLLLACSLVGINFRIASPQGYLIPGDVLQSARRFATRSKAEILCTEEPRIAADQADIVYTDVWTSMGQENEAARRRKTFAPYQVNEKILSLAKENAILMHPLPAHRGEEVAQDILDGPRSVVFDQAENRMHLQKALLAIMLRAGDASK